LKRGEVPSISELTSFVAAAQHGSFTRAASELNLTQGAISRQIRDLESRLGIRLFERIRQRVVLTDAGKLYLSPVKKALDNLADATQKALSFSNVTILNLVVLPTFGGHWLVPRLPEFQNKHPEITIHLTTRQQPIDFAVEPFDIAIFHDSCNWPGTIAHHLLDDDLLAVCSPKLHTRQAIQTPADVAKFPLLYQTEKPSRWAEWMVRAGVTLDVPPRGHAYQNFAMMAQAAVAGLGIALLPRYLVEDDIADRRLVIVADRFARIRTSYYLIVPEKRTGAISVQAFAQWLLAEAQRYTSGKGHLTNKTEPAHRSAAKTHLSPA
jgi:LysR family transcriptional regulator, glycine cleavage system transcriptional activator